MSFNTLKTENLPSPAYVIDEVAIEKNLQKISYVQRKSGAKILLALKAFSMFSLAPQLMKHLHGVCASGLNEARLGREEFKKEVHTYSAAFIPEDFKQILELSDHVVFNSISQWSTYKKQAVEFKNHNNPKLALGLRINPEHSETETSLYDPCAPCSRMGIRYKELLDQDLTGITGIHFHTLCEQNFNPLERTLITIEKNFSSVLKHVDWVNFGGGHHITSDNYQTEELIECIIQFQKKWQVQVYLEPGEAIALNAGVFVCEVLDTLKNQKDLAILDASATCHMPDILEMPYRPRLINAGDPGELNYTYRLGGPSCLAGDIIGDYSFKEPLTSGQRLIFEDMAIYTMVKNTTFNGINLPSIVLWNSETQQIKLIKSFGYQDFKMRLS